MASARYVKAIATGNVKLRKAPKVSGEVMLTFSPLYNTTSGETEKPKSISIGFRDMEPLKRSDVTLENIKNSNLEQLVRRRAVVLLD